MLYGEYLKISQSSFAFQFGYAFFSQLFMHLISFQKNVIYWSMSLCNDFNDQAMKLFNNCHKVLCIIYLD